MKKKHAMNVLLSGTKFDTSGSDRSWREQVRQFCKEQRLNLEVFVKFSVRKMNAHLTAGKLRKLVHDTWTAFLHETNPIVPLPIRMVVAWFKTLIRGGKPLPALA